MWTFVKRLFTHFSHQLWEAIMKTRFKVYAIYWHIEVNEKYFLARGFQPLKEGLTLL